jgi:hypothetical protein
MYLLACFVIMWFTLVQLLSRMIARDKSMWIGWLYLIAGPLAVAPLLTSFYDGFLLESRNGLSTSSGHISVWLSLAGSCLLAGLFFAHVWKSVRTEGHLSFWRTGGLVVCGLAILETGIASAKQATFANDRLAVVNFDFFRNQVTDIQCDSGVLLARLEAGDAGAAITYRCPTSSVLNRHTSAPFVPWPDYREGSSKELGKAMQEMLDQMPKEG